MHVASQILRALLFVSPLKERHWAKALMGPADGFILDLEDSIGAEQKDAARAALPAAFDCLRASGRPLILRVNAGSKEDLALAADLQPDAVMLPKVGDLETVTQARDRLRDAIPLLASVEDPGGVIAASAIATSPGVAGLMFGAGDFVADSGIEATDELLRVPALMVVLAAKAAGIPAFGLPNLIAEYRDLDRLASLAAQARAMGFSGSPAIHPDQVPVLQRAFAPDAVQLQRAREIAEAFERSDGSAFAIDGRLVDLATYRHAKAVLDLADG